MKNKKMKLRKTIHNHIFKVFHSRWLTYNTCWEDPRIDRELLNLNHDSKVIMITSAGCNVFDYLFDSPAEIHTVDINLYQNALLHLKLSLIEHGNYNDLFDMFGVGSHKAYNELYSSIRKMLPLFAKSYWDKKIHYFSSTSRRKSFYYYGTVGTLAWFLIRYFLRDNKVRFNFLQLLDAKTLEEQKEIYRKIEPVFQSRFFTWVMKQPVVLAMMGVPNSQYQLIHHSGGLAAHIQDKVKHVFTKIMIRDNYFWRVYLTGSYIQTCCPNYLKKEYFTQLQTNIGRVYSYNFSISEFLKRNPGKYTHFVLLDHQDWLASHDSQALKEEWQLLLDNSRSGSKILMRSAIADINFLPEVAKSSLKFFPEITNNLHKQDRVGTYGSILLAEVI